MLRGSGTLARLRFSLWRPDEEAAEILTVAQLIEYVTFAQAIKETAARPNLGPRVALR